MKITIQSIRFDAAERLQVFIQEKFGKLDRIHDGIVDIQVYLKLEKNHQQGNKVVEVKVLVPSQTLVATSQKPTFEEAVDNCLDQIKRQLIKHKEKALAEQQ